MRERALTDAGAMREPSHRVAASDRPVGEDATHATWVHTELAQSVGKIARGEAQWIEHGVLWENLAAYALARIAGRAGFRSVD